jgi:acyl carrier protein
MDESSNIQSSNIRPGKIAPGKIQQARILEIVRRVAARPVDPAPDESLFESGMLDSFSLTDLVSALETEFSIRVPDADLTPRKFDSLVRIQAYLESRV